ncbi:hypothetical protein EV646_108163 [Kribbella antiqua]|uniref:Uncharacterized protein n=1 Tax=Kribbella antiqua TaxID=2512217 RepID=A0A4V2S3S1_9ACTN|nr:hypothetical protein EV646_108163 [Kribbella antiqua]
MHDPVFLDEVWADRLGIDSVDGVEDELRARFEHLSRFVLCGGMPPAGKAVSAEAATAYGELWVLSGFLADAKRVLSGEEDGR